MIYAQIKNNIVMNVIDIEDLTLLPLFAEGFDWCLRIDNLSPVPTIGWIYNLQSLSFSPPLTDSQSIVTARMDCGAQIILQWNALNMQGNIYAAGQTIAFLAYVGQLYQLLSFGYLSDASDAMIAMIADTSTAKTNLDPFLTDDILYSFQNQISAFMATESME